MRISRLFKFSQNPWANGLRLALLNTALAGFCIASFLGTLAAVVALTEWRRATGGSASDAVPFPYPVLFLLYTVMFLVTWVGCGRRLPGTRRARFQAALVGLLPFLGLGLLGVAGVGVPLLAGDFNSQLDVAPAVFVYGLIAILILMAGLTYVGLLLWLGKESDSRNPLAQGSSPQ